MKIDTTELDVNRTDNMRTFKLRVSQDASVIPIIIKMMADQYKNPLKTISVEYVQNSIDSHRMAGKSDTPIQVHLPNKLDPYFRVRDFGISMTPDTIENVFSALFASTKREDDDAIGGFGVGRLVFGAYTGTMTVTTFLNGKKTEYFFYLDNGKGDITEMMSVDSDEPQGVEISIPIKEQDFNSLKEICEKQYAFLSPAPIVTGNKDFSIKDVKYKFEHPKFCFKVPPTGWYYNRSLHDNKSPVATVAQLPYPIDVYSCNLEYKYEEILERGAVLHFDVGEVDIVPSRDNLKYTEKTRQAIKSRLDLIIQTAKEELEKLCDSANFSSEYEARVFYYKIFETESHESFLVKLCGSSNLEINYNGVEIKSFRIPCPKHKVDGEKSERFSVDIQSARIKDNGRLKRDYWLKNLDCCPDWKYIWVSPGEKKANISKKIKYYINDISSDSKIGVIVPNKKDYSIDDLCDETKFDRNMIVDILDIELPKNVKTDGDKIYRRPKTVARVAYCFYQGIRSGVDWYSVEELDLAEEEGFWCNREGDRIEGLEFLTSYQVEALLKEYNEHNDTRYKLYSIPKSKNKYVNSNFLNFAEEMKKFVLVLKTKLEKTCVPHDLPEIHRKVGNNYTINQYKDYELFKWVSEFNKYVQDNYPDFQEDLRKFEKFEDICSRFSVKLDDIKKEDSVISDYKKIYEGHKKNLDIIEDLPYYQHQLKEKVIDLMEENIKLKKLANV